MKNNKIFKMVITFAVVILMLCAVPILGECGFGVKSQALSTTGQCGENVYWNFDSSTGKLVISGSGPMYDYSWIFNTSPLAYQSSIKSVVFEDGVTSSGAYSLWHNNSIKSVSFGEGFKQIGDYSFQYTGIATLDIPDNVVYVGVNSFSGCNSLSQVNIGKGVKKISSNAFGACNSIMEMVIPKNVIEIEDLFGSGANSLHSITIENPDCIIDTLYSTIPEHTVIYGYPGSTAETYAKNNNRTFKEIQVHTHVYTTQTTQATTSKNGKVVTYCTECDEVASSKTIYKISSIKLSTTTYTYNGKAKTPTVTVKDSSGKTLVKDTDYTVKYASGRKAVGTYNVKVTFKGNYTGSKTLSFKIVLGKVTGVKCDYSNGLKISWNKVTGATGYEVYLYYGSNGWQNVANISGTEIINRTVTSRQKVKVRAYCKSSSGTIYYGEFSDSTTETQSCTHTYKTKTTKATTSKNGKTETSCTKCGDVKSLKTIYKIKSIKLSKTSYTYDENEKKPSVVVKDSKGNTLKKGTDYTVKDASGRKAVGTYKVTVTFKGNYSGSKTLTFKIVLGQVKNLKQNTDKTGLAVSWSKVTGATGYQIYEYNCQTKEKHYIKNKDRKDGLWTITNQHNSSANGEYKWKVRACYIDKNGKAHYGAWSTVETFKGI